MSLRDIAKHRGSPVALLTPGDALSDRRLRGRSVEADSVGIVMLDEALLPAERQPCFLDHRNDQIGRDLALDPERRKTVVDKLQQRDLVLQLEPAGCSAKVMIPELCFAHG
jgi:hypothetical protein